MTDAELQTIRERCAKATPGPWLPYLSDGEKLVHDGSRFFPDDGIAKAVSGEVVKELVPPPCLNHPTAIYIPAPGEMLPSGCEPIASHRWITRLYDYDTGESPVPEEYIPIRPHDAVFIAHARTDIPALLAEVERLRGWLEMTDEQPIRTAVAAERERCARVADAYADDPEGGSGSPEEEAAARTIAAHIRSITPHGGDDGKHDSQAVPR